MADIKISALPLATSTNGSDVVPIVQGGATKKVQIDDLINPVTGWANYADTQYTSGSPFLLAADTDTVLPNNAGSVLDTQKPDDVTTFYDGSVITGRNGDGICITVDMEVIPTSAGTTLLEVWFDIGGAVGELYRRPISFPKGQGVVRHVNFTVTGYTLDTWEANGASVYVRANGTASIYGVRYVVTRTHKAR
jgi:hypothetical protein